MDADVVFPSARRGRGMYESFYLRAVSPTEPVGVWVRHTVHKAPGRPPTGSVWCTVFDATRGRPLMHKLSGLEPTVPPGGWIAIGQAARIGSGLAEGSCGPAHWSLRFASDEAPLRHLKPDWLYRAPLPRTKLTSPAPAASFDGVLELEGREALELRDWRGMVGHNWGAEHAERWIWLHGIGFEAQPEAWLDVALGRLKIAGRMTPWVANGALSLDGRRWRIGGLGARGLRVSETAEGASIELAGEHGLTLAAQIGVPGESAAGWRYADPDGGAHDVVNCSVASIDLTVASTGAPGARTLRSRHGGVYELGMRERDHGVPIAPFSDG
jgi:hypothetical protein